MKYSKYSKIFKLKIILICLMESIKLDENIFEILNEKNKLIEEFQAHINEINLKYEKIIMEKDFKVKLIYSLR